MSDRVNLKILNPVWSETDDLKTLQKILYLEKTSWVPKTWYKASSKSKNPDIVVDVRRKFDDSSLAGEYLKQLQERYLQERFTVSAWRQKEKVTRRSPLYKRPLFLTGFIPRVVNYCRTIDIECSVDETLEILLPELSPFIDGMSPRDDQERILNNAFKKQRGYIESPTGSGKTLLAAWIFSAYPSHKRLFLCHTISLLTQTYKELLRFGFKCSMVGDMNKDLSGDIVVSTIQSFVTLPVDLYDQFDIVICDECHHIGKFDGEWAYALKNLSCPVRIGLSATPPIQQVRKMALEGFLGPEIDALSLREGIEEGILVKPHLLLIPYLPLRQKTAQTYAEAYNEEIVNNRARNDTALRILRDKYCSKGETALIFVSRLEHARNLVEIADLLKFPVEVVIGKTESDERERIKALLQEKRVQCVISTTVWKEGVNIPSLDIVVPLGGGNDIVQAIGRGLRTFEGKKRLLVLDFWDKECHINIAKQAMNRLTAYCEMMGEIQW